MNIKNHTNEKLEDISKVIENPKNPNKHSDNQINMLSKIIEFQGWRIPIVVSNRSGFIVRGHGRLMSARKLGLEKVPVSFQDYESEAQEYADLVADNRIAELAEMDRSELKDIIEQLDTGEIDLDMTGFDQESLDDLMSEFFEPEEGLTDDDEIPEDVEARCKLGDLWQLGDHRLMCGDSTQTNDIDNLMNGEKADMVFTDPPYGMHLNADYSSMDSRFKGSTGGNKYKRVKGDNEDFISDLITTPLEYFSYCDELFFWGADYYAELLPERNAGSWIVWDKRLEESSDKMYGSTFELCWSKARHKRLIARIKWAGIFGMENEDSKKRLHPTQKPITLVEWFFGHWIKEKKNIVDLFLGSGSTLIACEKLKRKCFGMELDPHYCDVIIQRWEDFTGKKAEKIN